LSGVASRDYTLYGGVW